MAWGAVLGIPLLVGLAGAEEAVAPLLAPLAAALCLACGIVLAAPGASRRVLETVGRWGRSPGVTNAALLFLAVLLSLVAIETLLRALQPRLMGRGPYVDDPAVGGFRVDYGAEGNRLGFRDHEYALSRDGAAFRAVAIGDSFTIGTLAVDENWKHRLEARLRQAAGGRVEVINLGIPGTGPADYLRVLSTLGLRLAPDLVLVGFYVGNDLMDNEPGHPMTLVNGWPMEVRHRAWLGGLTPERFYLTTYLTRGLKPLWDAYLQRRERARGEVQAEGSYSREAFLRQRRHFLRTYERADSPWFRGQWGAVQGWLREMHQRARARGAEFVLALFPDQMQVEDGLRREVLDTFRLDAAAYDFERPQRLLRAFAAAEGIRVVDMLPQFRSAGRDGGLYLVRDSHWNAAGNRLAADILYEYLTAERLVAPRATAAR
jgi:lysophospholipase L1-like esterase